MRQPMLDLSAADVAERLRRLDIVNAASMRAVCRELSAQVASASPREVIALAQGIIEEQPLGAYGVAYTLIAYHPGALAALRARDLQRMGKHMCGWGDVDCVSGLAGVAWRKGQISDAVIHRWTRSRNRWWRRAALVSTVPLNMKSQGGTGDAKRTLAVCRLLMKDRDDMVVKAMSWALRALATREPRKVEAFVDKHGEELPRLAVREVRNKLRTGRKDGRTRS